MKLDISIGSTKLLTKKQRQELSELVGFCNHHDKTDLSFPFEDEEDSFCLLGYLPDKQLVSCLTLIPYEETLAECCAFTHPDFRRQGHFSVLLKEVLAEYPDVDLLFAVSDTCTDTLKALAALGAQKDSEEFMMECILDDHNHAAACADDKSVCQTQAFSITQVSNNEYALFHSGICCGSASVEPVSKTTLCLHHVEILPEFRNQGFGTAFLQLLLPALSSRGVQKVILHVTGDNAAALALYKKTGFSVTKTLSYYFY